MKAAIYVRVSTAEQKCENQIYDLRELAAQRGLEVVQEYQDCGVSGRRAKRLGLDALIADARRKKFSVVLVAAFDRVARSVKHFLQVMDEFDNLGIVFISRRENVDTSGPMGRLFLTLIGSIAELESDLIREPVLAGRVANFCSRSRIHKSRKRWVPHISRFSRCGTRPRTLVSKPWQRDLFFERGPTFAKSRQTWGTHGLKFYSSFCKLNRRCVTCRSRA